MAHSIAHPTGSAAPSAQPQAGLLCDPHALASPVEALDFAIVLCVLGRWGSRQAPRPRISPWTAELST